LTHIGKILIIAGIILVITGVIIYFAGNRMNWIGHLPGDIRIEKENFRFYFPVTTMIILSIVVSLIIWFVRKIF